jgi:hypothetical protein
MVARSAARGASDFDRRGQTNVLDSIQEMLDEALAPFAPQEEANEKR